MSLIRWILALFGISLGLGIAGLIIWDIYLYKNGYETISRFVEKASEVDPIIAVLITSPFFFVVGCLCGHWWFPQQP